MATKKIKRFQEGGMSDKDRGLEASKDEKVGFFERLRMGNIDEEGSEAYRRFGAGRGKAERPPVETMAEAPATRPTPAAQAAPDAAAMDEMEAANAREPIPVPAGPRAEQPKPGGKPRVNVQASKPSAPAKSSPKMQEQTYRRTSGDAGEREPAYTRKGGATAEDRASSPRVAPASNSNYSNEGRGKAGKGLSLVDQIPKDKSTVVDGERVSGSELGRNVATTMAALGPVKGAGAVRAAAEFARANRVQGAFNKASTARRTAEMRAKGDATKFSSKPKSTQKNTAKKTKKFDDEESNVEFKRGGSISGASRRADGIATKGKTRCKMR
jgi:hypothetical protein